MRDYRSLLQDIPCWDATTQATYEACGEPAEDCVLQTRGEFEALCAFIEAKDIVSYLEIGTWTGRHISALHRLFNFKTVAACDDGWCRKHDLEIRLPSEAHFFEGSSRSPEFAAWRAGLGPIDLVFIDGDHSLNGVTRDFEIQRAHPHRFLAFHDITGSNRHTIGVRRFWESLPPGDKLEILHPHTEIGLDHSDMGIGIWSSTENPR